MSRIVACLALPIWLGCGGPCEVCADVSGTYEETMAITNVGNSSCNTIYSTGATTRLVLHQTGSQVRLSDGVSSNSLNGVLNADESLQMDAFNDVAHSPGGDNDVPITILLSGVFDGERGARTFDGVYQATAKTFDCVTRITTHWVQVKP